jgi:4-hydroxy-tetrahydrodipicolinate reductase
MSLIKVGINGANGRMGAAIETVVYSQSNRFALTSRLTSESLESDIKEACKNCDVIIDFSRASSLKNLTRFAAKYSANLLVGTTGLEKDHFEYIKDASKDIAIIYAPNTSLGANLLEDLSMKAAKILNNYDVEIVEAHHKYKKDSPSGTAIAISKAIANVKGLDFDQSAVFNRAGSGLRKEYDISIASVRGGGIFGEHEVIFAGDNELVTISHRALSRLAFAEGAVYAAAWLAKAPPAIYSMRDVLDL